MSDKKTETDETKVDTKPEKNQTAILVTSDRDLDFSFGWGISAGQVKELPVEESLQQLILSNYHVSKIK